MAKKWDVVCETAIYYQKEIEAETYEEAFEIAKTLCALDMKELNEINWRVYDINEIKQAEVA